MTQLEAAKKGVVTEEMKKVAEKEGVNAEIIRERVAEGRIVIPFNRNHRGLKPCGIGKGLSTKVNANIGTSEKFPFLESELSKAIAAVEAGADTIMDLSTGGDLEKVRMAILSSIDAPVGTVPIYEVGVMAQNKYGSVIDFTEEELFEVIEKQAEEGVDFMTVHCGLTIEAVERLRREGRITDIVSRGGSFITAWMLKNEKQNPLYEHFDRLLEVARKYDVTLSLGDGLRPGCLADATDRAQIQELLILGELVQEAIKQGVQVMVEGPGHVPIDQIESNIRLQKRLCHEAPFYVLGPLVTDIAAGYDHIAAAIGGAIAAACGADFLCYVTPAEHLGLPDEEDVRIGVIASKIAAHAADIVKGIPGAWERDLKMAKARKNLDWEEQIKLSIDPKKARKYRQERNSSDVKTCTMCGKFCAMDIIAKYLNKEKSSC
ncbi:phosphomethylpyrimidine synthase ThiC [Thermovenabulum gondwanense]|uniref:Phosphomethylpyrimidine synthase n=1 Tax=Thermovenabulum gondwanense TaxID=520767 RepID=A0A162MX53_9FIRM|nr:phosphomethylpyrimidine synthase ThiC [Thermovenabulum gondwanense]KYO68062.1 Phosphomethylpyrimidine synthase [Thermovenabulum gondwanense]